MYGLASLVPLLSMWCLTKVRGQIRQQKGIDGTCIKDCLLTTFCTLCTLVQEARVSGVVLNSILPHMHLNVHIAFI